MATWGKVQGAAPTTLSGSVATITTNAISAATAGNLLLCIVAVQGTATVPTLAGYALLDSVTNAGNATCFVFGKIAAGGETTAAPSWTGAGRAVAFLYEYSGAPATITGIVQSSVTGKNTGTSINPSVAGLASTSGANALELAIHARISRSVATGGSATGGFAIDDDGLSGDGTASTGVGCTVTHKILTADETPATQITIALSRNFASIVLALSPATGGPLVIAPTLAGTSSLSTTVATNVVVAPAVAGAGSLSLALTIVQIIAPTLAGSSSLTTAVIPAVVIAPTLAGTSALTTTLTEYVVVAPALAGHGTLAVTLSGVVPVVAPSGGDDALWYIQRQRPRPRPRPARPVRLPEIITNLELDLAPRLLYPGLYGTSTLSARVQSVDFTTEELLELLLMI